MNRSLKPVSFAVLALLATVGCRSGRVQPLPGATG